MPRTVWILGSGFSKPLGGPLLRDLFRQEQTEDVGADFPPEVYPELANTMPVVERYFRVGVERGLWENAEQFLARVDDAFRAGAGPMMERLRVLINSTDMVNRRGQVSGYPSDEERASRLGAFDISVRRALAAECCRFLMGHDVRSELWLPYREWAQSLQPDQDTVLCFNYDRVIEMAAEAACVQEKIWVPVPGPGLAQPPSTVPVLKLHGSVDWLLTYDRELARDVPVPMDPDEILRRPTDKIGIAAPGGSKARFVEQHLEPLWGRAEEALRRAERLMIVGYSFPDTDPTAQYRILQAFTAGEADERWAHLVLGAGVTETSRRAEALLRSTFRNWWLVRVTDHTTRCRGRPNLNIVQHPLWAQDFIGRHDQYTQPHIQLGN
jgi:hypothetical protein